MNVTSLHTLFNPKSIAVIGASNTPGSVGYALFRNLLASGFEGTVYPVNPNRDSVQGVKSYPTISAIGTVIDMAIIAVPAKFVPDVVRQSGEAGTRSLVIISAGFKEIGSEGEKLMTDINSMVEKYHLTVLGPNCLGFMRPKTKLNASFCRKMALPGGIAFISQSGALGSAILDWSVKENVGFSYFVSIGDMVDIGYHDLIDYFGNDPDTTSILIYMESLSKARQFLSAARGFARTKPIIILKVGKSSAGAKAALSHTGSITGNNEVYDAAFKRVGILRVNTISELFNCAKTLAMQKRPKGNRLAIITNAGGPGVIATDALIDRQGQIATLSSDTITHLNEVLPAHWSHGNPIDILGDADSIRYSKAVKEVINDPNVDGTVVILTPQSVTDAVGTAKELVSLARNASKTILAAWMGEDDVADARNILEEGKIPAFEKPEGAINAFMNMYAYDSNLKLLYETPDTLPHDFTPKYSENRELIKKIMAEGRFVMTEPESKQFLANYDIPIPKGKVAHTADEAAGLATELGFPVVMKIVSPQILHKTDVGGVVVGVKSQDEAKKSYEQIVSAAISHVSDAKIDGVYIEAMAHKKYELLVGCKKDPIFGPAIVFGTGGTAVEVYKDTNIGLPPLNMNLAELLIEDTKIYQLLKGYRGAKSVNLASLKYLLYKFAYLIMDFPEIKELDINPLVVDEEGEIVLDAKVILDDTLKDKTILPYCHMVISPYPKEYEKSIELDSGQKVFLRPIRPEDEKESTELFKTFSAETQRFRFFGKLEEITHELMIRYTQIDYDREIAVVAELQEGDQKKMLGIVRIVTDPYNENAEFAIVVGDPWQKQGLGTKMMEYMLEITKKRGIKKLFAFTLIDNNTMIHLFEKFNFTINRMEDMYKVELQLS